VPTPRSAAYALDPENAGRLREISILSVAEEVPTYEI